MSAEATPGKKGPGGEPGREVWENLGEVPKLSDSHAVGERMFFWETSSLEGVPLALGKRPSTPISRARPIGAMALPLELPDSF